MYILLGLGSDILLAKKERWAAVRAFLQRQATPEYYTMFDCLNPTISERLTGKRLTREAAIRVISVVITCLFLTIFARKPRSMMPCPTRYLKDQG